jgi:hypothetical protein
VIGERRVIVEFGFEAAVSQTSEAISKEGLQVIASIELPAPDLDRGASRSVVLEAWSPELWLDALELGLGTGSLFVTTFAIHELGERHTTVVVIEPFSPDSDRWRRSAALAALADRESTRVTHVLERLQHSSAHADSFGR